jgi:hypothetical protein
VKTQNIVEFADFVSRRRAWGTALATLVFVAVQFVDRPVFRSDGYGVTGPRAYMWALNAGLLLLLLLPATGFIWGRRVRELVNDEVSRSNSRSAAAAGFGVAMVIALGVYALAPSTRFTAREAAYLVVTSATTCALLTFAWLESRAHRDG